MVYNEILENQRNQALCRDQSEYHPYGSHLYKFRTCLIQSQDKNQIHQEREKFLCIYIFPKITVGNSLPNFRKRIVLRLLVLTS